MVIETIEIDDINLPQFYEYRNYYFKVVEKSVDNKMKRRKADIEKMRKIGIPDNLIFLAELLGMFKGWQEAGMI